MKPSKIFGSFLTLGLLSACTTLPGASGAGESGNVTLEFLPQIVDGGYGTQAEVLRNTKASIDHLTVTLQRKHPATEAAVAQALPQADLDKGVRFSNLKPNSTYWIEAKAFKAADESVPANLISEPATAAIEVNTDDQVIVLAGKSLTITLKDVAFNGAGNATFNVVDGGYVTTSPATLSIAP
ncbi:hypothetical protein D3C72_203020 [compost metagenome]